jgi:hypothetical protein
MLGVYYLSGLVAHELSGLESPQEVTHETDRSAAGGPEDAIRGGLLWRGQEGRLSQQAAAGAVIRG